MSTLSHSESSHQAAQQPLMPSALQNGQHPLSIPAPGTDALSMSSLHSIAVHPSQLMHEQHQHHQHHQQQQQQQQLQLQQHDGTDAEMEAHMPEVEDMREGDDKTDEEAEDSDTNTKRTGNKARKPHLQGRFSGRLETKADEKRLADECKLLGHLLGGVGKRGEKSRLTLAKIVRGIATGDVRRHCESREAQLQQLKQQVKGYEQGGFMGVQPDPDTKMIPVQGFRSDQQPLATAIGAGGMAVAGAPLGNSSLAAGSPVLLQVPAVSTVHAVAFNPAPLPGSAATAVAAAVAQQELRQQQQTQQSLQPLVVHGGTVGVDSQMGVPSPKAPMPSTSLPPQAAHEAQALANASETLKAQAQTLKAHADNLTVQSYQTPSQPAQVQVAVKAQSLATHAQSLEAQAEAQNLQAQAQVHAHAQAEAQAQAQRLAAQAQAHAQAQAQANAHASQLKSAASFGSSEVQEAQQVAAHAQNLEAQAHAHAEAQVQAAVQAHSLAAKAQAHANAQAQARAQAQNMAFQAHNLQAHAQQLEVESAQASTHINIGLPHQEPTRPASTIQPGPLSQLITSPHDSNTAAAPLLPAPVQQHAAQQHVAAAAPALAKLSVQTVPTLHHNSALQAPALSTQLHPLPQSSLVHPPAARGSLVGQLATAQHQESPKNHLVFAHPASTGLQGPVNPVFLLTSSPQDSVSFLHGQSSPTYLASMPVQAPMLQPQLSSLHLPGQAIGTHVLTQAQANVLHQQLANQQMGSLQQSMQLQQQAQQQAQQQPQQQQVQQGLLQHMQAGLGPQMNMQSGSVLHSQDGLQEQRMQGGPTQSGSVVQVQMMQPDNVSQLSGPSTNAIANALGLAPNMGLTPADSAHEPTGSHLT